MAADPPRTQGLLPYASGERAARFREREDRAREERRRHAADEAAVLFRAALTTGPMEYPLAARMLALLCEAVEADYASLTVVAGDEGRLCHVAMAGDGQPSSRRWPAAPRSNAVQAKAVSARIDIERICPAPSLSGSPLPVAGATAAFHVLVYQPGGSHPVGRLSLYARRNLPLGPERAALIDVVANRVARELAMAELPQAAPI